MMMIKNWLSATGKGFRLSLLAAGMASAAFAAHAETVTIGGANYSEQTILANIYASALKQQGIEVKTRLNLGNREIIIPALKSGELDVVPEYLGALLNYYHGGSKATTEQEVSDELKQTLPADLQLLNASPASSITAWAVRAETAKKYNLKTLSDLAKVSLSWWSAARQKSPPAPSACRVWNAFMASNLNLSNRWISPGL